MFPDVNKTLPKKGEEDFTGNIEKEDNSALAVLKDNFTPDNEKGVSEENLEGLRAEFVSLGGLVTKLPEVSEVRDWTMVGLLESTDAKTQVINLFVMTNGEWQSIIDIQAIGSNILRASADAGAFAVDAELTINTIDVAEELVDANADKTIWTLHNTENLDFAGGVFTVKYAGYYNIQWSISFTSIGSNKVYECGLYADGVDTERGYAQVKIITAGDVVSFGSNASNFISEGTKLSLYVTNTTDAVNFIVQHASLTIHRIR